MQWLDKVQGDVGVTHSLDFYEGCVETAYQLNKISVQEYDARKNWIDTVSQIKTKKLLERVK